MPQKAWIDIYFSGFGTQISSYSGPLYCLPQPTPTFILKSRSETYNLYLMKHREHRILCLTLISWHFYKKWNSLWMSKAQFVLSFFYNCTFLLCFSCLNSVCNTKSSIDKTLAETIKIPPQLWWSIIALISFICLHYDAINTLNALLYPPPTEQVAC